MANPLRPTSLRNLTRLLARQPRYHSTSSSSSSVSPSELSHFAALASSWWDPLGPSRLLHLMNPHRHRFIRSCLSSSPTPQVATKTQNLRYLDIGCGGGIFAESAARLPTTQSVTAIDPTAEIIAIAKAHARQDPSLASRLTYLNNSIEDLQPPSSPINSQNMENADGDPRYDILTLFEVIEHVSSPSAFLSNCLKHVKPGGWIIGSTIARSWTSWVTTKVVAEDIIGIVPQGTHDWDKYINPPELEGWFRSRGWGDGLAGWRVMGVIYVPGLGWREVKGSEEWGNYFWGVRRGSE